MGGKLAGENICVVIIFGFFTLNDSFYICITRAMTLPESQGKGFVLKSSRDGSWLDKFSFSSYLFSLCLSYADSPMP